MIHDLEAGYPEIHRLAQSLECSPPEVGADLHEVAGRYRTTDELMAAVWPARRRLTLHRGSTQRAARRDLLLVTLAELWVAKTIRLEEGGPSKPPKISWVEPDPTPPGTPEPPCAGSPD